MWNLKLHSKTRATDKNTSNAQTWENVKYYISEILMNIGRGENLAFNGITSLSRTICYMFCWKTLLCCTQINKCSHSKCTGWNKMYIFKTYLTSTRTRLSDVRFFPTCAERLFLFMPLSFLPRRAPVSLDKPNPLLTRDSLDWFAGATASPLLIHFFSWAEQDR